MIILHDEIYYKKRRPQPDLGPVKNFLRFIWNDEKRTFFDRTAKEWGKNIIYLCALLFFNYNVILLKLFM